MNALISSVVVVLAQVPFTSARNMVQRVKYKDNLTFMSYVIESHWQYVYCL
jgi:hypothetical protein